MSRERTAREVALRLASAEARVEAAVIAVSELSAALPVARRRLGLAAGAGQRPMEDAGEALALLLRTRARLGAAHRRLAGLAGRIDLDLRAAGVGPLDKPDEDGPRGASIVPLRPVGRDSTGKRTPLFDPASRC